MDEDSYADYLVEWQRRFGNRVAVVLDTYADKPGADQITCARLSSDQYSFAINRYDPNCSSRHNMRLRAILLIS